MRKGRKRGGGQIRREGEREKEREKILKQEWGLLSSTNCGFIVAGLPRSFNMLMSTLSIQDGREQTFAFETLLKITSVQWNNRL